MKKKKRGLTKKEKPNGGVQSGSGHPATLLLDRMRVGPLLELKTLFSLPRKQPSSAIEYFCILGLYILKDLDEPEFGSFQ